MKKNVIILVMALFCVFAITSCEKKSKVAEAAERIESLASDVESLADQIEVTTDPEKLQNLMVKGKEIERKSQAIADEFHFISCSPSGELSVKTLTDEESKDRDVLDKAIDKLDKAYIKILTKSVKEAQNAVESMSESSSDDMFGDMGTDGFGDSSDDE